MLNMHCYVWAICIVFCFFLLTNGKTDGETDRKTAGRWTGWTGWTARREDGHFQGRIHILNKAQQANDASMSILSTLSTFTAGALLIV